MTRWPPFARRALGAFAYGPPSPAAGRRLVRVAAALALAAWLLGGLAAAAERERILAEARSEAEVTCKTETFS